MSPDPYQPCPCGSGKKYKFCCKSSRRYEPPKRPAAAREDDAFGPESGVEANPAPIPGPLLLGGMRPAEAMVAYARPRLDAANGSEEKLKEAMALAMACWNLAVTPDEERDARYESMRSQFNMDPETFAAFRSRTLEPLVRRHHEMFPEMRKRAGRAFRPGADTDS